MSMNYCLEFNNFSKVDYEGIQSTHSNPKAAQDSHALVVEDSNQQTSTPKKSYKKLSRGLKEGIVQGLKSAETIRKTLSLSDQKKWKDFVRNLESQNKNMEETTNSLDPKIWKKMLKAVIPEFDSSFKPSDQEMEKWWRKVKRMLGSYGKTEKRGDPTLYDDEIPEFNEGLVIIIRNLKSTRFEDLRKEVLPLINGIRTRNGREAKNDVFSKHYWYEHIAKHSDIKKLWEALPGSKTQNGKGKTSHLEVALSPDTQSTCLSSSETLIQSPLEALDNSVDEFGCVRFLSSENSLFSREESHNVFGKIGEISQFVISLEEEHSDEFPGTPRFGNSPALSDPYEDEEEFARFKKAFVETQFPELEEEIEMESNVNQKMINLEKYSSKALSYDDKILFEESNEDAYEKQVFGGLTNGFFPWKNQRNYDEKIELEDNVDDDCFASQKPIFAGLSNGFYL